MVMDTYEEKHFNNQRHPKRNWRTCEIVTPTPKKMFQYSCTGQMTRFPESQYIPTLKQRMGRKMQIDDMTTD